MLKRLLIVAATILTVQACQKSKSHGGSSGPDPAAVNAAFAAACQAGGGQQKPGPEGPSASCICGTLETPVAKFAAEDFAKDPAGNTFLKKCTDARAAQAAANPPTQPSTSTGAPVATPANSGTPAQSAPLTAAELQLARSAFRYACTSLTASGAYYYDALQGAPEPQCICGSTTTTLSSFTTDTVVGFRANRADAYGTAFANACKVRLSSSVGGKGTPTQAKGTCSCRNENDFPTCDGCTIHNWCVLRDGAGRLIAYSDRTAVSDGYANSDCSNDCTFIRASSWGQTCPY